MVPTPLFRIFPPLLNSSNPWATTKEDLLALYACPYTGAVTLRTSLWGGFPNDPNIHQYTFFSPGTGHATVKPDVASVGRRDLKAGGVTETCSLNTLGYSPITFEEYSSMLVAMSRDGSLEAARKESKHDGKPFIVSVSGTADEVARCAEQILILMNDENLHPALTPEITSFEAAGKKLDLMMEINLSCPNIPDKPPPAYDGSALTEYITAIAKVKQTYAASHPEWRSLHVGIKTPPYTHAGEFKILVSALEAASITEPGGGGGGAEGGTTHPISFITATNTLGSCLVLDSTGTNALASANGSGIGGMAGEALHPLALGNVRTIRAMLDASAREDVRAIQIIGIGGVNDAAGWARMKSVGACAVGVGTALGREGVDVFGKIADGLGEAKVEFV